VFKSWNGKRAVDYRRHENIPDTLGTAVNIVTMVFGNMGNTSGTGVAFTRNPSTGEKLVYGEYLINAQGEDVVAGIRTPQKVVVMSEELPEAYAQFMEICEILEKHYRNMQDVEFTIERGKLWMLADPQRQAHCGVGHQDRGGHGQRGAHHQEGSYPARLSGQRQLDAAPAVRPRR
jgi:pyruvate, orthophosphate dikinase